ncbi:MAG: caspase family protein [Planctomycetaceae bacterium]
MNTTIIRTGLRYITSSAVALNIRPSKIWKLCIGTALLMSGLTNSLSQTAVAQTPDRPRLALDFRGPAGRTLTLGFTPDGRRVFSGGQNKFVQLYDLNGNDGFAGNALRWEFSRGNRGDVNAMVISASQTHYAFVAGVSARSNRDIAVFDLKTETCVAAIPNDPASPAHQEASILSLAVSSDGTLLASASDNGEVWVWDLSHGPKAVTGNQVQPATHASGKLTIHDVAFMGRSLLFADRATNSLKVYNADSKQSYRAQGSTGEQITAISSSPDGLTALTADVLGTAHIFRDGKSRSVSLASLGIVHGSAVSPDGRWIAVTGRRSAGDQGFLALIDAESLQLVDQINVGKSLDCRSVAFSPESSQLLTHDDSREVLLLFETPNAANPRPLSAPAKPPVVIASRGRDWKTARFLEGKSTSATGYALSLTDSSGAVYTLDASAGVLTQGGTPDGITPDRFARGWQFGIIDLNQDSQTIQLTSPAGSVHRISIARAQQGYLTGAYCFLPDANQQPIAVAVGTRNQNEVYIYRLADIQQRPMNTHLQGLVRHFRDHSGLIHDLSVSADGRYLVSTSIDKSIRIWSLSGLDRPVQESIYGASIVQQGNDVVFQNVDPAGIAFARGARNGSHLHRYGADGNPHTSIKATEMLQMLAAQSPLLTGYLWIRERGVRFDPGPAPDDDRIVIVPGWEPLMTLVVDRNDDWVLFTPEGYYNASVAEGNRLFGWQINQGRDVSPRYESASHLQKIFEKPNVIDSILKSGSVAAALGDAVTDFRARLGIQVASQPQVEILAPEDGQQFQLGQRVELQARITFLPGTDPSRFVVSASNNARQMGVSDPTNIQKFTMSWTATIDSPLTELRVAVKETNPGVMNSLFTEKSVHVHGSGPPPDTKPHIFYLGVAVEAYDKATSGLQKLDWTIEDVNAVAESLRKHEHTARHFDSSELLTDANVSLESLNTAVRNITEKVKARNNPSDLVVIYVAGHGVTRASAEDPKMEQFYFLPANVNPDVPTVLHRDGISWPNLTRQLDNLNCHVSWFIDACESGSVRHALRDAQGPHGRTVICAADADQKAFESREAVVSNTQVGGHGFFTMAVLETLDGNSLDPAADAKAKSTAR